MTPFGIRKRLKDGLDRLMGGSSDTSPPNWQSRPPEPPVKAEPPRAEAPRPEPARAEAPVEPPRAEPAPPPPEPAQAAAAPAGPAAAMAPDDDTAGPAISFEQVQELLDEMVRPALQGDGGDITLIKVEDNNIYVRLVGSCSTCPSSIMTMKMGVEALLKEEFPQMNELVQVS